MALEDIYNKARKAANMGNYEYAIELFREVLRNDPEHPEARLLLRGTERRRIAEEAGIAGKILASMKILPPLLKAQFFCKNPSKKLELYENVLESMPNSMAFCIKAGKAARQSEYIEAAITIFKDVISKSPENKKALKHLGELLQEKGDTEEALKYLSRLNQLDPDNRNIESLVKNLEAEAHMQKSKMDEAASFRDMIKDKEVAEESVKKFETADEKRKKEIQNALDELKKEPNNVSKIIRLANLLEQDKQSEKALKLLTRALQKQQDNYEIRQKLGDLKIRKLTLSERELQEKLESKPDDTDLSEQLTRIRNKRKELAVKEYKWRVQKHPTDRDLKLHLAHALFEADEINSAIAAFQQAGQSPNLELEAATMLGKCFSKKGQYDMAIEQFRRALGKHKTMDKKGMELHYYLAQALENNGETQDALSIYKRLYSNDISFKDVAEKVDKINNN